MDRQALSKLISHFDSASSSEAIEVNALCREYPYSQLLHTLAARAAQDNRWTNVQQLIQIAAVYATDRAVLKEMMTKSAVNTNMTEAHQQNIHSKNQTVDYADELIHDLEKLKALRLNFESQFADATTGIQAELKESQLTAEPEAVQENAATAILQNQPELHHAADHDRTPEFSEKERAPIKSTPVLDPLIEELQASRSEIPLQNEKTLEQVKLIDEYIQASNTRKQPVVDHKDKEDLSSAVKPGVFGDHIISETLADILIKQGKKDKAVEVLRKLIWKFPQKKAYFAARIEELKK